MRYESKSFNKIFNYKEQVGYEATSSTLSTMFNVHCQYGQQNQRSLQKRATYIC